MTLLLRMWCFLPPLKTQDPHKIISKIDTIILSWCLTKIYDKKSRWQDHLGWVLCLTIVHGRELRVKAWSREELYSSHVLVPAPAIALVPPPVPAPVHNPAEWAVLNEQCSSLSSSSCCYYCCFSYSLFYMGSCFGSCSFIWLSLSQQEGTTHNGPKYEGHEIFFLQLCPFLGLSWLVKKLHKWQILGVRVEGNP